MKSTLERYYENEKEMLKISIDLEITIDEICENPNIFPQIAVANLENLLKKKQKILRLLAKENIAKLRLLPAISLAEYKKNILKN